MKKIRTVLICMGIVLSLQSVAQNIPLGTLPMLYNGGFAGECESPRFVVGTGVTGSGSSAWTDSKSHNYYASYDQFFSKLRSGIGVTFTRDYYASIRPNDYTYDRSRSYLSISFSPKFSFKGKYTFAPFVDFNYIGVKESSIGPDLRSTTALRTGFLFNSKKFYAGVSIYSNIEGDRVLTYPNGYAKGNPIAIQTGYTFQKLPDSKFAFTPQVALLIQNTTSSYEQSDLEVDLNLMFRYRKFIWSVNNNGLGLGFQNDKFRIMLSQNYIFFARQYWSGSLSMRYVLPKTKK